MSRRTRSKCTHLKFNMPTGELVEVQTYSNDGITPHFHVVVDGKTIGCLKLDSPEYYDHGYIRTTVIDKKILIEINKQLSNYVPWSKTETEYMNMRYFWNITNRKTHIPLNIEQPDYTKTERRN